VGLPGAPDTRNARQRTHGRSGSTGPKERTLFVQKRALSVRRKVFFLLILEGEQGGVAAVLQQ